MMTEPYSVTIIKGLVRCRLCMFPCSYIVEKIFLQYATYC